MNAFIIQHKEVIVVYAQIATVCVVLISAVALILSFIAFWLQRKTVQANMFNEISERISDLVDKEPYQDEKAELRHWYERLFNAFEYLAFHANSHNLTRKMKKYYKSFIEGYCKRIKDECPELVESFKEGPPDRFCELRKYHKDLPF